MSGVAIEGTSTRRLNRPSQAQIKIPMDRAVGDVGSKLKIYFDGWFHHHGRVLDVEVDSGTDEGYVVYNSTDPMEMWQWRPARDGPASTDPGDFSNPLMFYEFVTGPQILEQCLLQSENDSDPGFGEGPLFLALGTFETGGVNLSGGPTDWPMTIAQVASLLVSTGEVDIVITPIDSGVNMGRVDVWNGDYGTDKSGSVVFQYGMGNYSIERVRWNKDMSQMCNKLWYYGGPRILTAADPEGNQHWCWNITGDDPEFNPSGGTLVPPGGRTSPPASATNNPIGVLRANSQGEFGVRMDIKIWDAVSDLCIGKGGIDPERWLYRRLWQVEQWIRAQPRELIHITPTKGTGIGSFDIGDLIGVQATSSVFGGFSGAQRVYEYTVSWNEDGPFQLSELQTSPIEGGF